MGMNELASQAFKTRRAQIIAMVMFMVVWRVLVPAAWLSVLWAWSIDPATVL